MRRFPYAGREPLPGAVPGELPLQGAPGRWPRGDVSSARFERALPATSTPCLLPLGYEDLRASGWSRTSCLPLTGRTLCPGELQRRGRIAAAEGCPVLPGNQPGEENRGADVLPFGADVVHDGGQRRTGVHCPADGKAGVPGFEPGKLPGQSRAGLPVPPYPIAWAVPCPPRESNPNLAAF